MIRNEPVADPVSALAIDEVLTRSGGAASLPIVSRSPWMFG
jgi:hypothetical protein